MFVCVCVCVCFVYVVRVLRVQWQCYDNTTVEPIADNRNRGGGLVAMCYCPAFLNAARANDLHVQRKLARCVNAEKRISISRARFLPV